MTQTLYLVRGIPGSGKTTRAQQLVTQCNDQGVAVSHLEADQFFTDIDGQYTFVPSQIRQAHEWCRRQTRTALDDGDVVVVANTFTQNWELKDYIDMALAKSIPVVIIQCCGQWNNVHGVPPEKVQGMLDRFEDNETIKKLWESHDKFSLISFE